MISSANVDFAANNAEDKFDVLMDRLEDLNRRLLLMEGCPLNWHNGLIK